VQADGRGIVIDHGLGGEILTLKALYPDMCKARLTVRQQNAAVAAKWK
jgi:hypothetical protein